MFTLVCYVLRGPTRNYRLCDIYTASETKIALDKMEKNRAIIKITVQSFLNIKEAQLVQQHIRLMVDRSENKIAA